MAKVVARYKNESLDSLLRRFKKKVAKENIIRELKRKEAYEKPSEKRVRERNERKKKIAKANAKMKELEKTKI